MIYFRDFLCKFFIFSFCCSNASSPFSFRSSFSPFVRFIAVFAMGKVFRSLVGAVLELDDVLDFDILGPEFYFFAYMKFVGRKGREIRGGRDGPTSNSLTVKFTDL